MNQSDRANPRRLIRAIEIATSSQNPNTKNKILHPKSYTLNPLIIGLTAPNQYLYDRADKWLQKRLDHGLIEEVRELMNKGVNHQWLENLGLEYRWITRYLSGKVEKEVAIERLKGDIHDFIRRQKTYSNQFKSQSIRTYDISEKDWLHKLEKQLDNDVSLR